MEEMKLKKRVIQEMKMERSAVRDVIIEYIEMYEIYNRERY